MSDKVQLTIDGRAVSAVAGDTVIAAARAAGVDIPTLCAHPRLSTAPSCRVCVVEIEGQAELAAACQTQAASGMVVCTQTERVQRARRLAVEFILSDHPVQCMSCAANGECELQTIATRMGIHRPALPTLSHNRGTDDSSPVIRRDMDKCILCGRCVAICNDVGRHDALAFVGRGRESTVACAPEPAMADSCCVSCGDCVQVCSTGALVEKHAESLARAWELRATRSICPFCGVGCAIDLQCKGDQVVRVRGRWDGPANRGSLCARGRFGPTFVNHADRLRMPLIRRGSRLVDASWEDALDFVAERLEPIVRSRPQAIGIIGGAACTNEACYFLQKFGRAALGTNNIDSDAGFVLAAPAFELGGVAECERADAVLVVGAQVDAAAPVLSSAIKRAAARGARLIVAESIRDAVADKATDCLRLRAGAGRGFVAAFAAHVLQQQNREQDLVRSVWDGLEGFAASARRHESARAAEAIGLAEEEIAAAARALREAERVAVVCGDATLAPQLNNLGLLLEGRQLHLCWVQAECNSVGAALMGMLPDRLPGGRGLDDAEARARLAELWQADVPDQPGMSQSEMLDPELAGRVRALYVVGANPAARLANAADALAKLDLLVCQDILLTETARLADVVLPAASFAEQAGTLTNHAGHVQALEPAFAPVGDSKPDWEIAAMLGLRLGGAMGYNGRAEVAGEMAQAIPGFGDAAQLRPPRPSGLSFAPLPQTPDDEDLPAEFPLEVVVAQSAVHWGSGARSRRSAALQALAPHPEVSVNPEDAAGLGIGAGDRIEVVGRGWTAECRARVDAGVPRGAAALSPHFSEANPAALAVGDAHTSRVKLRKIGR